MLRVSTAVAVAWTACLLTGGVARADTIPAFGSPGVPSPGSPNFWGGNVDATLSRNGNGTFTLSVVGSTAACGSAQTWTSCGAAIFNVPGAGYLVGNESLNITANFSSRGVFSSGTYTISGSLPASSNPTTGTAPLNFNWGAQGTETLLTANLTGDAVDSSAEALGFNEVITGGWADQSQFTSGGPESVWLYSLLSGFDPDKGDHGKGKGKGQDSAWNRFLAELVSGHHLKADSFAAIGSVATVPLPGAVVLLGSAIAGLLGVARRRRLSAAS